MTLTGFCAICGEHRRAHDGRHSHNFVAREDLQSQLAAANERIAAQDAELAALRRAVERYKWLRRQLQVTRNRACPSTIGLRGTFLLVELHKEPKNDEEFIDAAIDAELTGHD